MLVAGYISTPPELKAKAGKSYHQFRLAVLSGRGESRKTTWFTVRAYLSELDADMLEKGQRVEVTGVLTLRPYVTGEGSPAVESIIESRYVVQAPVQPRASEAPPAGDTVQHDVPPGPRATDDVAVSVLRPAGVTAVSEAELIPF